MPEYRVLVIDDQRDVRQVLRAGLETLGTSMQVIDVPSGEEALLVASRQPVDLLVIDVHLPGISGLELRERVMARNPKAKMILITGRTEPKVRREVANAGADAFFFKPIEITDFLDAVQHCLGLVSLESEAILAEIEEKPKQTLSQRISALRHELNAVSVLLMDDLGQIVAQAGDLPFDSSMSPLMASAKSSLDCASKVAYDLNMSSPRDVAFFAGQSHDLCLGHVGQTMGVAVVVPAANWDEKQTWLALHAVHMAAKDLLDILADIGVTEPPPADISPPPVIEETEEEPVAEEVLEELNVIFDQVQTSVDPDEANAFWESLADAGTEDVGRIDAISYDQARQLGLAPEE